MSQLKDKSILVVDDELTITKILSSILRKNFDCEVFTANSFTEAKSVIQNVHPIISFVDINLGDGNGYDLLVDIKKKREPTPFVIIMSAYSKEQEQVRAIEKGADCFISKPFDRISIVNAVMTILAKNDE